MRVGLGLCSVLIQLCCSSPCCCLFYCRCAAAALCCSYITFFPILVFVPFECCSHVFLLSLLVAADRMRHDMDQVGDIVFCSTIGWSSKYRVSNKLETVKLRKSKIRKANFFRYSEAQVFHYLGCGRIGSL